MTAQRIVLLVGLPISEADFLARLEVPDDRRSDFLSRFDSIGLCGAARTSARREVWRDTLEPLLGAPLSDLARKARSLGFEVRRNATLDHLRAATRTADVIVIVSHWKGAEFANDDFGPDLETVMPAQLAARDHPLAHWLLRSTGARRGRALFGRRPLSAREALRRCLLVKLPGDNPGGADRYVELATTTASRRRDALDEWLSGHLKPGNRLELFDGLYARAAISKALSVYSGVVDLTVCTSTYLGDYIGAASLQAFRTVQFLNPQDPYEAAFRLGVVLGVVASGEREYLETRAEVSRQMSSLLRAS